MSRLARAVVTVAVIAAAGGYATRGRWVPALFPAAPVAESDDHDHDHADEAEQVRLSPQAQKNLRLATGPLQPETFWKTIAVPGVVIDRPGVSDRGGGAPVTGVVSRIHKVAGDPARPGEVLFTLRLLSEPVHQTQTDLFKAAQDLTLARAERKRLADIGGAVEGKRLIEADNQITRLEVALKAYRQELLTRGLAPDQIDGVADGRFVTDIPIRVPAGASESGAKAADAPPVEVQELKVELGQQVQAGQTLCLLANHRLLSVEGRAFRDEVPALERSVREGWPVEVDFGEADARDWPPLGPPFRVTTLANTIDPDGNTFRFLLPLDNQARAVERAGRPLWLWRFRPGQRVRVLVRAEKLDNVFVLPAEAVARDGADAYVFRQNGDVLDRKPVHVVYQDRQHAVVADDGSVPAGVYVARSGAAQLNRMVKAQAAGPAGHDHHDH
ncbi:MAG: efflux RND transporter periplasmic adaptor subunit [Gemmataceae bacterium]|nr:efflux RND transporter periplasmic adaptor subunit [Gemmataceae bacterium]